MKDASNLLDARDSLWHQAITDALAAAGTPRFYNALKIATNHVTSFDTAVALLYRGKKVNRLYSEELSGRYERYLEAYCNGASLLDPHYTNLIVKAAPAGLYFIDEIVPDYFEQSEFFQAYFKCLGIVDGVNFITPTSAGYVNFFLDRLHVPLDEGLRRRLRNVTPLIVHALQSHAEKLDPASVHQDSQEPSDLPGKIQSFGKSLLTEREHTVLQLMLRGYSGQSISEKLNISAHTVKVHRYNLYRKLDIDSQIELFALCLQALTMDDAESIDDPLAALFRRPASCPNRQRHQVSREPRRPSDFAKRFP